MRTRMSLTRSIGMIRSVTWSSPSLETGGRYPASRRPFLMVGSPAPNTQCRLGSSYGSLMMGLRPVTWPVGVSSDIEREYGLARVAVVGDYAHRSSSKLTRRERPGLECIELLHQLRVYNAVESALKLVPCIGLWEECLGHVKHKPIVILVQEPRGDLISACGRNFPRKGIE